MAQPRIFVPGPAVNPGLVGSPAQYLNTIANTAKNIRNTNTARKKLEQDKLFQDSRLAQHQQQLDFNLAEPERAVAEELRKRELANEQAKIFQEAVGNAGGSRVDTFLANPEAQARFQQLGITDPNKQREMVESLAAKDRKLFSDPTIAGQTARDAVIAAGGSLADAQAAQAAAPGELGFTKMDPDLAVKMMDSKNSTANSLINSLFGSGSKSSGLIEPQLNQLQQQELSDALTGRLNIEDARGGGLLDTVVDTIFGGDATRSTLDFGDRDLDQQDITRLKGSYQDVPDSALIGALQTIVDPDSGTIDQDKWLAIVQGDTSKGPAKDFLAEARSVQNKIERRKGAAGLTGLDAKSIFALSDALRAGQDARNLDLASRTSYQADSFADRLAAFNQEYGIPAVADAPNAAPPGQTTPAPPAGSTGSTGLDALAAETEVAPVVAQPPAEGPPGQDTRIFVQPEKKTPVSEQTTQDIVQQVAAAEEQISIFGNGTKENKDIIAKGQKEITKRQNAVRVSEIEAELQNMPRPDQRTLAQTAYARSLEKELRDLKR